MIIYADPKKVEDQLVAAAEKAVEKGWKICYGSFGNINTKCCCPLTALALSSFSEEELFVAEDGTVNLLAIDAALTGKSLRSPGGFTDYSVEIFEGFDDLSQGVVCEPPVENREWYEVGRNVLKRLNKKGITIGSNR